MAKDARGHGSDGRLADRINRFVSLADVGAETRQRWMGSQPGEDKAAANLLGQGHPKSQPVPVHGGAFGRRRS